MHARTTPWRVGLGAMVLGLLPACRADEPPATDDTGSTTAVDPGTTAADTTGTPPPPPPPPTTTDPTAGTTFGDGCGPDPCGPCDPSCEVYSLCIKSVWMCECICPETSSSGGDACIGLDAVIDDWVGMSKTPAISCGHVDETSDAVAWQTMHDCVLTSVMGSAFRATWSVPDLAPAPSQFGAAGRVIGVEYQRGWFEQSEDGTLVEYGCDAIVATPGCVVDVGEVCLSCESQTEVTTHCEPV